MALRRIKRTTFFNFVLGIICQAAALSAVASQLSFDVTATRMNYDSAMDVAGAGIGAKTTAMWTNVSNTYTASAWQPGQLTHVGPQTVTMTGPGGASFKFNIDVKGLQFGGISKNFKRLQSEGVSGAPKGDFSTNALGDGELVVGSANGYSNTTYTASVPTNTTTPFTMVRPVFAYDERALVDALNPKTGVVRPVTGVYRASIPLSYRYRVLYKAGGIWTYETRTFVFSIDVKFLAGIVERVDVVGTGDFILTYPEDRPNVTGKTIFNVTASGMMPKGLRMRFIDHNRQFHLKAIGAAATAPQIPYNLSFLGNGSRISDGNNQLVKNGRFTRSQDNFVVVSTGNDIERLRFDLIADFDSEQVPVAIYTDTFVVIFDVVIE